MRSRGRGRSARALPYLARVVQPLSRFVPFVQCRTGHGARRGETGGRTPGGRGPISPPGGSREGRGHGGGRAAIRDGRPQQRTSGRGEGGSSHQRRPRGGGKGRAACPELSLSWVRVGWRAIVQTKAGLAPMPSIRTIGLRRFWTTSHSPSEALALIGFCAVAICSDQDWVSNPLVEALAKPYRNECYSQNRCGEQRIKS